MDDDFLFVYRPAHREEMLLVQVVEVDSRSGHCTLEVVLNPSGVFGWGPGLRFTGMVCHLERTDRLAA